MRRHAMAGRHALRETGTETSDFVDYRRRAGTLTEQTEQMSGSGSGEDGGWAGASGESRDGSNDDGDDGAGTSADVTDGVESLVEGDNGNNSLESAASGRSGSGSGVGSSSEGSIDEEEEATSNSNGSDRQYEQAERWRLLQQAGYVVIPARVDAIFRHPTQPSRRAHEPSCRIDTGASVTAIPKRMADALKLPSKRRVRVRTGGDQIQYRSMVEVEIECEGRKQTVDATVRVGPKLGNTVILGRNYLQAARLVVFVDPEDGVEKARRHADAAKAGKGGAKKKKTVTTKAGAAQGKKKAAGGGSVGKASVGRRAGDGRGSRDSKKGGGAAPASTSRPAASPQRFARAGR